MVAHLQHGSLSSILEPCIATPLLIPMVFSECEGVDVQWLPFWIKLDLEMLVGGGGVGVRGVPRENLNSKLKPRMVSTGGGGAGLIQGHIDRRKMLPLLPKDEGWRMAAL